MRRSLLVPLLLVACRGPSELPHADGGVVTSPRVAVPDAAFDMGTDTPADTFDAAPLARAQTGPFEAPFSGKRAVWWVAPRARGRHRLMAMLHGVCNPPAYTCGSWSETAKGLGFLVCPEGDGKCPASMYNAPTWNEGDTKIDEDLEKAIATVEAHHPGELARDAPVLLGFSRGAYVSVKIAAAHPGRWPYLVLVEASPNLDAKQLRAAGVRAVALVAGEIGSQIAGEKKTAQALAKAGFPARFWMMPGAGHHYSNDVDVILREAVEWTTSVP